MLEVADIVPSSKRRLIVPGAVRMATDSAFRKRRFTISRTAARPSLEATSISATIASKSGFLPLLPQSQLSEVSPDQTERWIAKQRQLFSHAHYLITFTLPAPSSVGALSPKLVYGLLMKAAADALQKLADDPRFLGARLGALAVLHTWRAPCYYHPHVHMLVTAGGLVFRWLSVGSTEEPKFLVPVRALSVIFAAKMRAAEKSRLREVASESGTNPGWYIASTPGSGRKFSTTSDVTCSASPSPTAAWNPCRRPGRFRYRDNRYPTAQARHALGRIEFLRRFLQHVLPPGCMKVRYYGIFSPHCQSPLNQVRSLIPIRCQPSSAITSAAAADSPIGPRCPRCLIGTLLLVGTLQPERRYPP